jgi:hypothetical protein
MSSVVFEISIVYYGVLDVILFLSAWDSYLVDVDLLKLLVVEAYSLYLHPPSVDSITILDED